jgi:hypothetical protein
MRVCSWQRDGVKVIAKLPNLSDFNDPRSKSIGSDFLTGDFLPVIPALRRTQDRLQPESRRVLNLSRQRTWMPASAA